MKKVKCSLIFLLTICLSLVYSQSYNTAFGFRLGEQLGFNLTQRLANHTTADLSFSNGLFSDRKYVMLNLRQHYPVLTRRLNFFLGAGAFAESHLTSSNYETIDYNFDRKGISAVMGAELTLGRLNISIDYMPKYLLQSQSGVNQLQADSALSIKYLLWKRKGWFRKLWEKIF